MLQKASICICLLVPVVAEWIKIPVLNPQKPSDFAYQYSYIATSPSILQANTFAPSTSQLRDSAHSEIDPGSVSKTVLFKNNDATEPVQTNVIKSQIMDSRNTISPTHKEYIREENTEIDTKFLQSVMNNSQKADRIGQENVNTQSKGTSFFETLKDVHRTLVQETPTTITGKMKFLQDLQVKLYSYITPRIKRLWDVDRQARTEKGMGFPSMDGALMTICFLLFAVFLIKLVKQLIQQLQEKANANALMMTGATPVAAAPVNLQGRRKRSLPSDVYAAAHVLNLIESFHVQYNKLVAAQ